MSPKSRPTSSHGGTWVLRPGPGSGSARLLDRSGLEWRLRSSPDGFTLEGPPGSWALRLADGGETQVLVDASGEERVRASALIGPDEPLPCDVLLGDGRLFRLAIRLREQPVVELRSWEVPGAYLVALPAADGWRIEPTPAGEELEGCDELALLIACCLLRG